MSVWIYFIRAKSINRIKIGRTRNLQQRIRHLEYMNGDDTDFLGCVSDQLFTESQLHNRFAKDRAQGEWFYASDELLEFIEKHAHSDHPAVLSEHRNGGHSTVKSPEYRSTWVDMTEYLKNVDDHEMAKMRLLYGDEQVADVLRGSQQERYPDYPTLGKKKFVATEAQ